MMIKLAELAVAIVALLVAYFTAQSKAVPTGTAARGAAPARYHRGKLVAFTWTLNTISLKPASS